MGLFKKKAAPATTSEPDVLAAVAETIPAATRDVTARREWDQMLVAAETGSPPDANRPAPLEPTPAPLETELESPVVEPEPPTATPELAPLPETATLTPVVDLSAVPLEVPTGLEAYARVEGSMLILKEPYLDRAQKEDLERQAAKVGRVRLAEHRWHVSEGEALKDVEEAVDALQWTSRYEPKAASWLRANAQERRKAMRGLERVPANIVAKRVVYETGSGFVIEVTYRELGELHTKHFTVPAAGNRTKVLDGLRAGGYAQATIVNADLVDALRRSHARSVNGFAPGKIQTWPIQNRHPVTDLHGVSTRRAVALSKLGIRTTDHLRLRPAPVLARHLGVSVATAGDLHAQAELLLVKGLGENYAPLLVKVGVRSLEDLRRQEAAELAATLNAFLASTRSRTKPPRIGPARAAGWIRGARLLRRTLQPFPR